MATYPGGKAQAGVYQRIICELPPHTTYIEPFLGAGAIMRYKRPAQRSIGVELDPAIIDVFDCGTRCDIELVQLDALSFLRDYPWSGGELVYCDPPYLMDVRSQKRAIYACEFSTREQHVALLLELQSLPAMVAISGYWSDLYAGMLAGWRSITFQAVTRGGSVRQEWLWMNYPEPRALHDYTFLGDGFLERQRIQRKINRWKTRLARMPAMERLAMMAALQPYQE